MSCQITPQHGFDNTLLLAWLACAQRFAPCINYMYFTVSLHSTDLAPTNGIHSIVTIITLIARLMGPTWDPSGADMTQVGPMLAPWTLLSGYSRASPCFAYELSPRNFSDKFVYFKLGYFSRTGLIVPMPSLCQRSLMDSFNLFKQILHNTEAYIEVYTIKV